MTARVLELEDILVPDMMAVRIAGEWVQNDLLRRRAKDVWEEVDRYVHATDTTHTSNAKNPWKNSTTIPKLCQISDNLYANYTATMFPKRKWLRWEPYDYSSKLKTKAITSYMAWAIEQPLFKEEMDKIILDYIRYGNCIATVQWVDERVQTGDRLQQGFVGPTIQRISPLDIVMNPAAPSFRQSPKIVRSLINMGEVKEMLQRMSNEQNRPEMEELWDYMKNIRSQALSFEGEWIQKDNMYAIEGFTSYRDYLRSEYVEVLTFYGDLYDYHNDKFWKNHVITVVDRHKLLGLKPNPSYFGYPPMFHAPWRKRQDNLWGMGPLDNLVGMQYRVDHLENTKADILDFTLFPVQKVKGFVEDFVWQPGEKIFVSEEGDVEITAPDVRALQVNVDIRQYLGDMEEFVGAPKEAMGIRSPGEKTAFEVQQLMSAASRLFQNKIKQFEEQIVEPLLNAMLELARRNLTGNTLVKVFNDEVHTASFQALEVEDITGVGRIRPIAARHFAEQAETIQNLTSLSQTQLWPLVMPHISGIKLAAYFEDSLDISDYEMVLPWAQVTEQAEGQKMVNALQEHVANTAGTASGMGEDYDLSAVDQYYMQQEQQQAAADQAQG